jgi:hypothetical protein
MQSASVKRCLRPVHNALYDHISSFGWCVRGDVRREDYEAIYEDRRAGEDLISGDYSSATDMIYTFAVDAIVDVLAECPELTEKERSILVGSFSNLRWVSRSGRFYPIKRGSMMGNLVSFPLLCLLNKACYDICCDITFGTGSGRVGRFNGDDCAFAGTAEFFALWRQVTSTFGLIVNEEKTGFESEWLELNSQPFSVRKGRLVDKPVISFLRPRRKEPGDLLTEVLEGIKTFKKSTRAWILNVAMRHEISLREISVSNIPSQTLRYLLSRSWFRRALQLGPAPVRTRGQARTVEMVVKNPPRSFFYPLIEQLSAKLQKECVEKWEGKKVQPLELTVDRRLFWLETKNVPTKNPSHLLIKGPLRWQFVWPKELYHFVSEHFPQVLLTDLDCQSLWLDDHHFLTTTCSLVGRRPARWYLKMRQTFAPILTPRFYLRALTRL